MNARAPQLPTWSVLIPFRDEAGNIAPLLEEVRRVMAPLGGFEIVGVDDGSADGTAAELASSALLDPSLRIATHRCPAGQSQALITAAGIARAPWIITLDGDGQNDPADIAPLMAAWSAAGPGAERTLFIGQRCRRLDSTVRRFASRFANTVRAALLGDRTPDGACGLRLLRRDMFLSLPRFDALHRFMPALVLRAGGRVVSVPVCHRPRRHGLSKYGIWRRLAAGVIDVMGVLWLVHRHTAPQIRLDGLNSAKNSPSASLDLTRVDS